MITAFMKVISRPELATIGMGVLICVQGIGQFLGTFLVQGLLGPSFENTLLAGSVVMVIALTARCALRFARCGRERPSEPQCRWTDQPFCTIIATRIINSAFHLFGSTMLLTNDECTLSNVGPKWRLMRAYQARRWARRGRR